MPRIPLLAALVLALSLMVAPRAEAQSGTDWRPPGRAMPMMPRMAELQGDWRGSHAGWFDGTDQISGIAVAQLKAMGEKGAGEYAQVVRFSGVTPDDTLAHALRLTRAHRIRHLPVVLGSGELTGIVSDRDIRLAMPSPLTVPDAERLTSWSARRWPAVMSREVVTVAPRHHRGRRQAALPPPDRRGPGGGRAGPAAGDPQRDRHPARLRADPGRRRSPPPGSRSRCPTAGRARAGDADHRRGAAAEHRQHGGPLAGRAEPQDGDRAPGDHRPARGVEALEAAGFEVGWPSLEADLRTAPRRDEGRAGLGPGRSPPTASARTTRSTRSGWS
jgi:hypothetical protein